MNWDKCLLVVVILNYENMKITENIELVIPGSL